MSLLQNDVPNPSLYGVLRWNSEIWAPHGCQISVGPADLGAQVGNLSIGPWENISEHLRLKKKPVSPWAWQ